MQVGSDRSRPSLPPNWVVALVAELGGSGVTAVVAVVVVVVAGVVEVVAVAALVSAATGDLSVAAPLPWESEEIVDTSVVGERVLSVAVALVVGSAGAAVPAWRWSDIVPKDSETWGQRSLWAWPKELLHTWKPPTTHPAELEAAAIVEW